MTYQDDPNRNRRNSYPMTQDRSYGSWIIGALAAVAVIAALIFMFGRDDKTATATNSSGTTPPATTGSAVPAPMSGNGTAGAPRSPTSAR